MSVQPAGSGRATVQFTVKETISLDGQQIPVTPGASGAVQWFTAIQHAGHWYVDPNDTSENDLGTPPCA